MKPTDLKVLCSLVFSKPKALYVCLTIVSALTSATHTTGPIAEEMAASKETAEAVGVGAVEEEVDIKETEEEEEQEETPEEEEEEEEEEAEEARAGRAGIKSRLV